MENTRSYASRFSGLILFILSLGVVGVLVFMTIRSARDNDNQVASNTNNPENSETATPETANEEQGQTSSTQTTTPSGQDETPAAPAETSEDNEEEADVETNNEQTASSTDDEEEADATPNTGGDEDGQVASEQDNLPNTGPESVLFGAIALAGLSAAFGSYRRSRRDLLSALTDR